MTQERVFYHYSRIVRDLKEILEDSDLTDEEKIKTLGTVL